MSSGVYGEGDRLGGPGALEFFVGREDELALLRAWIDSTDARPMAITGPAGMGKTALARRFALDETARGRRVVWVGTFDAADEPTFRQLTEQLRRDNQDGLLVVDDVEDIESLRRAIFYAGRSPLLFTTRDPSLGDVGRALQLEGLSRRESVQLVSALMPEASGVETRTLADGLEGSPLAMTLASRISREPRALRALLAAFEDSQHEGSPWGGEWSDSRRTAQAGRALYEEAMNLLEEGEYSAAVTRLRGAWASLSSSLGSDHPDSIAAKSELGRTLAELGSVAESRAILDDVVSTSERSFGRKAHATLRARANYAEALRRSGDISAAYNLLVSVLSDMISELGDHHPDVLSTQANLAVVARDAGDIETALSIQEEVVRRSSETYGSDHSFVLAARSSLAALFADSDLLEQSLAVQRSVVNDSYRVLGAEHPDTLVSIHNLASTLSALGKAEESLELETNVYAASKRTLGPRDHRTLGALNNLLFALLSLTKQTEALAFLRDFLADRSPQKGYDASALAAFCGALTSWAESAIETDQFEVADEVIQGVLVLSADWPRETFSSFSAQVLELKRQLDAKTRSDESDAQAQLKLTVNRLTNLVPHRLQ